MSFYEYVSIAQKKENAKKSIEKLRKSNPDISPVIVTGKTIVNTWWGRAWNKNLESYADYSNRIGRGRSYVKQGAVLHLKLEQGKISALVQGSRSKPYSVDICIDPLDKQRWRQITNICNRKIESLEQLISGKFPEDLDVLFTTTKVGIFPSPKEIHFHCSCPDSASLCKHVAATLYGLGARLDTNPLMFFEMREIEFKELIKKSIEDKMESILKNADVQSPRGIKDEDLFDLFGV